MELSSHFSTTHEKTDSFSCIKQKRKLHSGFYQNGTLRDSVEERLILAMTEDQPQNRPSALQIKDEWLPQWKG